MAQDDGLVPPPNNEQQPGEAPPRQPGVPEQPGFPPQPPGVPQPGFPQPPGGPQVGASQSPGFPPQQPGFPPPQPGFPQPGFPQQPASYGQPYVQYPEESQALLTLILSLVGIFVCSGVLSPVAWYFGNKELAAIDAGRRDPSKRDMAKAGQVIGIIGSVLLGIGIVIFVGFILLVLFAGAASSV